MPPAEWTPSSVRPMGKSPRVRVCYSSRHKGEDITKTGERDALILFLNPASACPDSEASGSITGHGSGCRGNRPPPAHCRLPRPWAGKERTRVDLCFLVPCGVQSAGKPGVTATPYTDTGLWAPNAFMYLKYFSHKSLKILEIYNQWVLF